MALLPAIQVHVNVHVQVEVNSHVHVPTYVHVHVHVWLYPGQLALCLYHTPSNQLVRDVEVHSLCHCVSMHQPQYVHACT